MYMSLVCAILQFGTDSNEENHETPQSAKPTKKRPRTSQLVAARDNSYIILTYQKEIKMCLN